MSDDLAMERKNPPSVPTLALVWVVGVLRGSKIIIDWHNLGYSILALKLGEGNPLVKIAKWYASYILEVDRCESWVNTKFRLPPTLLITLLMYLLLDLLAQSLSDWEAS